MAQRTHNETLLDRDQEIATLKRALTAMLQAFARHPGNTDERRHAITLADAALRQPGNDLERSVE